MPAPSDFRVDTDLILAAPNWPPPCPDGSHKDGPCGAEPAGRLRESLLTALLRALAAWPT